MQTKHLQAPAEIKNIDESGFFCAYGSVFDVEDNVKDVVCRGAFTASLETKMPALLWQHNASQPIGVYEVAKEDERGLYLEGKFALTTQLGREAYELTKMGAVNGFSIGYKTQSETFDNKTGINYLKEVELWEVSLVTFPCNEEARLEQVKFGEGRVPSLREFERWLKASGYSTRAARHIASCGYKEYLASQGAADTASLRNLIKAIKGPVIK